MQFALARRRTSVKETPGADLLYDNNAFRLSGISPHSPIAGEGRCSMTGLMHVGSEVLHVNFQYADYSREPFRDRTGQPYKITVKDADDTLTLECYRIEAILADTSGELTAIFDESSFADGKPSFQIVNADGTQIGSRWQLVAPTKEEFVYSVQRLVCRKARQAS